MRIWLSSALCMLFFIAGSHAAAETVLEEIVVTAQKVDRNQQDVPIALSVLSEDKLEESVVTDLGDIAVVTPGVQVTQQLGGSTPFIRGVGSITAASGADPSVAIYSDGVYLVANYATPVSFNDVERIEVLKGPQGTLFGRNSTGGLIHVISKTPSVDETEVDVSLAYANFDHTTAKLYASGGLSDTLAASIAVTINDQREGWGENLATGKDVNQIDEKLYKVALAYTPSDKTLIKASVSYADSFRSLGTSRQISPGSFGFGGFPPMGDFHDINSDLEPASENETLLGILNIEHDFEGFTFKSITAYQDSETSNIFDNDAIPVLLLHAASNLQNADSFSQEFQFSSNGEGNVQWVAGLYYNDFKGGYEDTGLALFGPVLGATGVAFNGNVDTRAIAAFGEIIWEISDKTELVVGARYSEEERELDDASLDIITATTPRDITTLLQIPVSGDETFDEPTWRAILSHDVAPDSMVYASYSRGFKSGNFSLVQLPDNTPFNTEILDAYEIGFKGDLADGRLRLNAAAFYYDYQDLQISIPQAASQVTANAGDAEVTGFEFSLNWLVGESLELYAGATILDSEFQDNLFLNCTVPNPPTFVPPNAPVPGGCNVKGNDLPQAPELTFSLSPTWTINDVIAGGTLRLNLTYYYNDGFFWGHVNQLEQDSYELLNASASWRSNDDKYGIRLFGANLTDEEYSLFRSITAISDAIGAAAPRTYGIEFSYSL